MRPSGKVSQQEIDATASSALLSQRLVSETRQGTRLKGERVASGCLKRSGMRVPPTDGRATTVGFSEGQASFMGCPPSLPMRQKRGLREGFYLIALRRRRPMRAKSPSPKAPAERVLKDIRRSTRKHYSAEHNIRIVLECLRGGAIASLCRWYKISVRSWPPDECLLVSCPFLPQTAPK